jgi:hypothetical protein
MSVDPRNMQILIRARSSKNVANGHNEKYFPPYEDHSSAIPAKEKF